MSNKIYLWKNRSSSSDFTLDENTDIGNHSGGLVVIAENKEDALAIARKIEYFEETEFSNEPVEIDLSKKGIVIYADGAC